MPTLYHAPQSRSSRIVTLLDELGAGDRVEIVPVTIPRVDGTGGPDAANPHPEGKVPFLVDGSEGMRESTAIVLYLTDLLGDGSLGPRAGEPGRAAYLSWLAYYAAVVEPVLVLRAAGIAHPMLTATFRGMDALTAQLAAGLADAPYLLGEGYTAADLMLASPFAWFPDATPDVPAIRDWVARTQDRDSVRRTVARDADWIAARG